MSATLNELIASIRSELSEGDAEFFTDADVTRFINQGQDIIAADAPWTCIDAFQTFTVAGQASYLLPPAVIQATGAMLRLPGGSSYRLEYLEPNGIDANRSFTASSTGTPRRVSYRQSALGIVVELWPVPPTTGLELTVGARVRPTPLVAETDRTSFVAICDPVLVSYALARCKRKDEETSQGDRYMTEFGVALANLRAHRMRTQVDKANINLMRRSLWAARGAIR